MFGEFYLLLYLFHLGITVCRLVLYNLANVYLRKITEKRREKGLLLRINVSARLVVSPSGGNRVLAMLAERQTASCLG